MTTTRSPGLRAAVLMNRPVQYVAPGLRLLAEEPGIDLRAYYWRVNREGEHDPGFGRHVRWSTDLYSGYRWWSPPGGASTARLRAAWRELRADRPEVILSFGWHSPITRVGLVYARSARVPVLYYGDSNARAARRGWRGRLRAVVLRRLFAAGSAVSTGDANRDFYLDHALPAERIHRGVLPAEVGAFAAARAAHAAARADADRTVARPFVVGFVGKLVPAKAVADLINAASRLPGEQPWEVRLIGDGPLRTDLERLVAQRGLTGRVRFLGFRNNDEVPPLVAEFDVLVLPSHQEPRGLVAVEAMAARVATVVSSATGVWGANDVVRDGETGLVYPAGDVPALARCLERLRADAALRARLAAAGEVEALAQGPQAFATTAAAALMSTAGRRPRVLSQ